jgi:hypothetical protein
LEKCSDAPSVVLVGVTRWRALRLPHVSGALPDDQQDERLRAVYFLTPAPHQLRTDLEAAAQRMLYVFLPYATLVLTNLALRIVPSVDLRSATSVFFLGPLTAIRPAVMVCGVVYGIWQAKLPATIGLGIFILCSMLILEFALNAYNERLQRREIESLV